jgi:hypothetical protein
MKLILILCHVNNDPIIIPIINDIERYYLIAPMCDGLIIYTIVNLFITPTVAYGPATPLVDTVKHLLLLYIYIH